MRKNLIRRRFTLHLFRSTFWNTGSGHIPHFFASCGKTKTPDFAWKSGVYCYLLFFKVVPPVPEQGSARAVECDRSGGTHPDARRLASSLERILRRRGLVPSAFPLEPARRRARRSDRHRRDRVRRTGKMYPGGRIQRISPPKADREPTQTAGIFFRKCRLFTKG